MGPAREFLENGTFEYLPEIEYSQINNIIIIFHGCPDQPIWFLYDEGEYDLGSSLPLMYRLNMNNRNYFHIIINCLLILICSLLVSYNDTRYISTGYYAYHNNVTICRAVVVGENEPVELGIGFSIAPIGVTSDRDVLFYIDGVSKRVSLPIEYFVEKNALNDFLNKSHTEANSTIKEKYIINITKSLVICVVSVLIEYLLNRFCKNKRIVSIINITFTIGLFLYTLFIFVYVSSSR